MKAELSAAPKSRGPEETAVWAAYQQAMDGWNKGSAEAFASAFTKDGDLVAFDGTHFKGRDEIVAFHQPLFDKWLKGTRLVGEVLDVRFLSPDIALMHVHGGTIMRGQNTPSPTRDSIQTLVVAKEDGQWGLAAFQNTRIRPMGRSAKATFLWLFTDWLWKLFRASR